MVNINIGPGSFWDDKRIRDNQGSMDLNNIGVFYTTRHTDRDRTDFSSTFRCVGPNETEQGRRFWKGLVSNMASLTEELGISQEEYINLACIAMALATHETGFGEEKGYVGENVGVHKFVRNAGKQLQRLIHPSGSASSGLTQIKIYDFMNDESKLSPKLREILINHGIEAKSYTKNNLFASPEKAAIATIVALKAIVDNYPKYLEQLQTERAKVEGRIDSKLKETRGYELIDTIKQVYDKSGKSKKDAIRIAFKHWLLALDGSTLTNGLISDNDYNEEYQLKKLNSLLALPKPLVQKDLDYIRYTLSSDKEKMNLTQFCAYAWNHGTGRSGMAFDRLLAEKVGIIFAKPDEFDYDQIAVNVENLAKRYAEQTLKK